MVKYYEIEVYGSDPCGLRYNPKHNAVVTCQEAITIGYALVSYIQTCKKPKPRTEHDPRYIMPDGRHYVFSVLLGCNLGLIAHNLQSMSDAVYYNFVRNVSTLRVKLRNNRVIDLEKHIENHYAAFTDAVALISSSKLVPISEMYNLDSVEKPMWAHKPDASLRGHTYDSGDTDYSSYDSGIWKQKGDFSAPESSQVKIQTEEDTLTVSYTDFTPYRGFKGDGTSRIRRGQEPIPDVTIVELNADHDKQIADMLKKKGIVAKSIVQETQYSQRANIFVRFWRRLRYKFAF